MTSVRSSLRLSNDSLDTIKRRGYELVEDPRGLRPGGYIRFPRPDYGSVEGHVKQLDGWQRRLRRMLILWDTYGCNLSYGASKPSEAWKWASITREDWVFISVAIGGGAIVAGVLMRERVPGARPLLGVEF
jgi:hypothetical protein